MATMGSSGHCAIIERVSARYRDDARVRAVAVFGSVATSAWHELSKVAGSEGGSFVSVDDAVLPR